MQKRKFLHYSRKKRFALLYSKHPGVSKGTSEDMCYSFTRVLWLLLKAIVRNRHSFQYSARLVEKQISV